MQVLPAKRQEENCTVRYPKGLKNQNVGHLCESNNFDEIQVCWYWQSLNSLILSGLVNKPQLYFLS